MATITKYILKTIFSVFFKLSNLHCKLSRRVTFCGSNVIYLILILKKVHFVISRLNKNTLKWIIKKQNKNNNIGIES